MFFSSLDGVILTHKLILKFDHFQEPEPEPEEQEILFVVDELEEYEAMKSSNMFDLDRLKGLLASKSFYVEDDFHIFNETSTCPAVKVATYILKKLPAVFPENYEPISKMEQIEARKKVRNSNSYLQ